MQSAYKESLMQLVEDFINSYDPFLEEPEHLREAADLAHFLQNHGLDYGATVSHDDLLAARELRSELRQIWTDPNLTTMQAKLNALLSEGKINLALEGLDWQFNLDEDLKLVPRLAMEASLGLVFTLQTYGQERLRACAASPCEDVFVDTSRNKARRFCSERCANRYNVAAFRERQKDE